MKKATLAAALLTLVLAGCGGNKLGIDETEVQDNVTQKALDQQVIKDGGYNKSDIELVKVCEAIEKGKEEFGYDDYYIVFWQTNDKKYQRTFLMKDNELSHGDQSYDIVEDRCIEPK